MKGVKVKNEEDVNVITVRIEKEGTPDFHCTMNCDAPLQKLMMSYCKTYGIQDFRALRFTVKGSRVRGNQTDKELRLKNGSVIDAWSNQIGGGLGAFIY